MIARPCTPFAYATPLVVLAFADNTQVATLSQPLLSALVMASPLQLRLRTSLIFCASRASSLETPRAQADRGCLFGFDAAHCFISARRSSRHCFEHAFGLLGMRMAPATPAHARRFPSARDTSAVAHPSARFGGTAMARNRDDTMCATQPASATHVRRDGNKNTLLNR